MKVPFNWLKEYIEGSITLNEVASSLTMSGLEVSAIEEYNDDKVLDIEVTPNRSDCLSIIGIAREIRAIFGLKLKKPTTKIKEELRDDRFAISIANPELCFRYAGRIIRDLKVAPSPKWLKSRLEKAGIRSINNVVDVTNYVLLEYGHPLHAFDLDFIEGQRIRVGTPETISGKNKEEIVTLDGIKRTVTTDDLLIWDAVKPIAIAGVMGGANTEVTEKTVNIIIESAYFKPESVRKTSKRLGLKTEASYRFERGTDIEALKEALDRAACLIQEIAGGRIYEAIDVYPTKIPKIEIPFNTEKICRFVGINLKDEEILRILELLEIDVEKKDNFYIAKAPTHRQDISIEEDIAEEVTRIYGYDKVPSQLPSLFKFVTENHELAKKRQFFSKFRDYMIGLGYSEAVNFSFMSPDDLDLFELPEEDMRRHYISLMNPLKQEESIMRTMLLSNLLRNTERNTARGIETLKLFEIGKIFIADEKTPLPQEPVHLGIITKKEEVKSVFKDDPYDFYALKGLIDGVVRHLKLRNVRYVRSSESFLHPGQSADIVIQDEKIGFIGVISPKILSKFDFKTKPFICMAELDLDNLFRLAKQEVTYAPFSNYPPIKRDTAIIVSADFDSQIIFDIINSYGSELIEDVFLFDVYQGKGIPEGSKSIAFRVIYRAFDRTLTAEEVETIHSQLINMLINKTGAVLRA
ncbi:phenylalanine--tRNA ligase subunit beta [Thermodesulfovibrio thiophilus]|uniref:phenylalanine--tRNA ligase subunit beta n=1 Tax=Thermodesulfovibrio thiophilus TaxID=340095 RepID=UPI00041894C6|nr:phenylalanine--tRNA ligase subunit beta [Thermodesulfovibrio thiophilus]